ncbi:MAG: 2-C-methyl-D-erythritol 4-phosphate cytidylyltransferase [Chitinophagaceae bacterium]|nr:2-C-methyl-D-erythritol 4-phosphate cytidylyltransferase [Chitinophagaceae bacterium]
MMYCVLVAAGSGSRMNHDLPKQFLPVLGKPLLYYTLQSFFSFDEQITVILVSKSIYKVELDEVKQYFPSKNIIFCEGGATRFLSVKNGLHFVPDNELVFIHDAARPFADIQLLTRCKEAAIQHGHAIPATTIKDSIRQLTGTTNLAIDRNQLRAIQTPQTFQSTFIKKLVSNALRDDYTDEATILEDQGYDVLLVEGSDTNFKVTLPIDLKVMEVMLQEINRA